MAKQKKKKKHRVFWLFIKLQIVFCLLIAAGIAYYHFGGYAEQVETLQNEARTLVKNSNADTFKSSQTSEVYAADGTIISRLKGERDSYYVSIDDIPVHAISAMVSIEDKKFFRHAGVDYKALLRAAKSLIENGEITQGGSTITMQLARNIFLTQDQNLSRKVEEIFIAIELEEKYSKDQIMEFYLNNIYFGNGYYGIQAASRGYFNRDVGDLSLSEIAFLCAIPNNPTLYDPLTEMENTLGRRDRILKNMLEDGKISQVDYADAISSEITLERPMEAAKNDYVETYTYYCATRALMEQAGFVFQTEFKNEEEQEAYQESYTNLYNEYQKKLYTSGYQIYTSIDLELQEELQAAVDDTLADFTDLNDEGVYKLQSSAVCIDNETGYVKAIVGGRSQDFAGYTLNRAYQSFRQPGSAIKPLIVYTPAFERNYTPDTIVVDEPVENGPKNANGTYLGEITVRTAVEKSVNIIAWKLFDELSPATGLSYLKEMNFAKLSEEDYRLPSALGGFTTGVSALEMASAYATIENDGLYRKPTCIVKILDANGEEIYTSSLVEERIYRQNAARMMTDVLTGVLTKGTGKGLALENMPSAGKTGTTNEQKDGWFVGYTRYYTTSVWVGYDMPQKLEGLQGASYPGAIWKQFMEAAHEDLMLLNFLPYAQVSEEYTNATFVDDNGEDDNEADEPDNSAQEVPGNENAENGVQEGGAAENGALENNGQENVPQGNEDIENGIPGNGTAGAENSNENIQEEQAPETSPENAAPTGNVP